MNGICKNCRWWLQPTQSGFAVPRDGGPHECHGAPPVANSGISNLSRWPMTHSYQTCAAYEKRVLSFDPEAAIDTLDMIPKAKNALRRAGITTIRHLLATPESKIVKIQAWGTACMVSLRSALDKIGVTLAPPQEAL